MIWRLLRIRARCGGDLSRSALVAAVGMSFLIGAFARLSSQLTPPEMGVQDPSFPLTLGASTHAATTGGNRVDVLLNGEQIAISSARQSIAVTNPHFVPDGQIPEAGFGRLLDAGVAIHEYQAGLPDVKMMTVDGAWGAIRSSNLDNRSLALNDKLNLVVYSHEMVGHLELLTAPAQTSYDWIPLSRPG